MAWTDYGFTDLPAELEPETGETLAEWNARVAAYDTANPGDLLFLDSANLEDALQHAYTLAMTDSGTALTAHTGDATAAHAASAISFSPTGTVAATTVQAAIAEVASEGGSSLASAVTVSPAVGGDSTVQAVLTTHETRLDAAQCGSAEDVAVSPAVADATDVQAALEALQAAIDGVAAAGLPAGSGVVYVQENQPAEGAFPWLWVITNSEGVPTGDPLQSYAPGADTAPTFAVAPAITGTALVGSTLTCDGGTASGSPAPSKTYQWKRDGTNRSGETASTYVPVSGDVGHTITCTVTLANGVSPDATATSNGIALAIPANTVAPAITGTAETGQTLSGSTGTWTGSGITYTRQWKRNGTNISGATASTYLLDVADEGTSVKETVTATNANGSASADSNTVSPTAASGSYFDPTPYGTVLAYYNPKATTGRSDGNTLAAGDMDDLTTHNRDLTPAGGFTYKTNVFGSDPAWRANGTDAVARYISGSIWHSLGTFTLVMKAVRRLHADGRVLLALVDETGNGYDYNSAAGGAFGEMQNSSNMRDYRAGFGIGDRTPPAIDTPFVYTVKYDGTNHTNYVDGTAVGPDAFAPGVFGIGEVAIGARIFDGDPALFHQVDYGPIVLFADALNDSNRAAVEAGL